MKTDNGEWRWRYLKKKFKKWNVTLKEKLSGFGIQTQFAIRFFVIINFKQINIKYSEHKREK